jgi:putative ABC transport system permease protein
MCQRCELANHVLQPANVAHLPPSRPIQDTFVPEPDGFAAPLPRPVSPKWLRHNHFAFTSESARFVHWPSLITTGAAHMESLIQDVHYGARKLARTPGFTLVVVATLTLAIGVTTAVFSIVNGVLLNPLGFARPDRLVYVQATDPKGSPMSVSPQDLIDYGTRTHSFTGVAAVDAGRNLNLVAGPAGAVRVSAARVGAQFFSLLGVSAQRGRTFAPGEDSAAAPKVVVLSNAAWRRYFGADPGVVGRRITLDDAPYEVIGVAPPAFTFPDRPDVWYPAQWKTYEIGDGARGYHSTDAIARLRDGVTLESAGRDLQSVAAQIAHDFPQYDAKIGAVLTPLRDKLVGNVERPLWAMLGAVGFVLLIACANVANLLLVRAASRESEIAVRTSLGAGRGRMLQQLLTESMLLALAGAVLGVLLASWILDAVVAFGPAALPRIDQIGVDWHVLAFGAAITVAIGLAFGILPAFHVTRTDVARLLHAGARGSSRGGTRTRSTLVILELALGMVLLVGAGLLLRSFDRLMHVDPGFRPDKLVVFNVALSGKRYDPDDPTNAFTDEVQRRLASLPGVRSVAVAADRPLDPQRGFAASTSFLVDGMPKPAPGTESESRMLPVSPSFFETAGMTVLRGRTFTDAENRRDAPPVLVVNEALAARYFPGQNPIGKHLTFGFSHTFSASPGDSARARGEIIGIVKNVRHNSLDSKPGPATYFPYHTLPFGPSFIVRTSGDPAALERAIPAQVAAVDRNVPVYEVGTMTAAMSESVAQPRFYTVLLTAFAGVALFLATLGVYGVISYGVSQRTREFGIRVALGATPKSVAGLVVRRGVALALVGVVAGIAVASLATRTLQGLLFGVQPLDAITFVTVSLLLGGVATLASWLPARRAARVDPVIAMRAE